MRISKEELERILERFSGHKVTLETESSFKKFALEFYPNNPRPAFHADVPIDVTIIYNQYKLYHQCKHATFNAFIYYHLIQTMQKPEFASLRYRYINNEWYCFNNLPFFISIAISDSTIQQVSFFIENVGTMTWREFVQSYALGIDAHRTSASNMLTNDRSWYAISHLLTNMPFDFTGYMPSQKHDDFNAHAPWFVISQRQSDGERMHMTLSCNISHASGLPSELNLFLKTLKKDLLQVPPQQQIGFYFSRVRETIGATKERDQLTASFGK